MKSSRWLAPILLVAMLLSAGGSLVSLYQARARGAALESVPSVSPLVARSTPVGDAAPAMRLSLSINVSLRNTADLARYLQEEYTPGSLFYHRYLAPASFDALYGPTAQDVRQVAGYLRSQGFTVTHAAAGQQVIDFSGTVAQAERAFAVQIHTYHTANGRVFYANSAAPRVPLALRPLIVAINGLDNAVARTHPPLRPVNLSAPARSPRASGCPGPGSNAALYLLPSQFASAYNFTGAYNIGLHGEGQSIALFELDGYAASDIAAFQSCYDAKAPARIDNVLIDGGVSPPGSGAIEVELDMEVLLGALHGLSNIFVYQAPNNDTGYNDEWNQIVQDDIPVVSTSWGLCESQMSASNVIAENGFFIQADAQGQSIVAAAGDNGAYDCNDGTLAVDDPASNPNITGVGGTHLVINSNNGYSSESVWSGTPNSGNGGGGGVSQLWTMPSYQSGPGLINATYSSGAPCSAPQGQYCREVPDVSLNADPDVGYVVYCTVVTAQCDPGGPFIAVGGTSAAAPMWAAIVALANEYALAHGGSNLGFLNPTLYALLNASSYRSAFHDVTSGTNLFYPAAANYDMATGIGTPNAYGFVTNAPKLPGSSNVPGSTRWYLAEGHVGNHFQEYLTLENPGASSFAHVTINYLLRGKPSFSQTLALNPSSRTTLNVNNVLKVAAAARVGQDVSLYITSDIPIIAERPIYFTYLGNIPGGSDIVGQTAPGMHFTFANGETLAGFGTYITVLNPFGQQAATVTASYYSGGSLIGQSSMTVPAGQRNTLMANNTLPAGKQFYIQVDSTQPVVVERPMYFRTTVAGISGTLAGGSSVQGVTPATDWYYASGGTGASGTPAQENLIIANPDTNGSGTAASVTITYALSGGTTQNVTVSVPARSQVIENVNADVGRVALVAMHVASTNGIAIVTERQQFFNAPALAPNPSGVEEVGETPSTNGLPSAYSFAEGHLGNSFSEFVTLFNPNNTPITVAITYFVTRGSSHFLSQQEIYLAAMGVAQVASNTFLYVPASSSGAIPEDTSIVVQSLPAGGGSGHALPVIAGRVLYFNYLGGTPGCTSVVGYSG
jgi:Pro-kumamolisin, activation domain/Subtilase family